MEKEIGEREGKFYAINVPLKDGIDDASFTRLFKTVSSARSTMFQINVYICCMRCQARTFYFYFFHFQFCRLFPRLLKHIYQVPLFYNVEQIRLLEIAWAASISPLMVHSNSFIILFCTDFATIKHISRCSLDKSVVKLWMRWLEGQHHLIWEEKHEYIKKIKRNMGKFNL